MNPKTRQLLYSLGTIATGLLTVLTVFNVIDKGTAINLGGVIASLSGLLGTAATGTAAVITGRQIKGGMFSPQAENPADRAVSGLHDVTEQYNDLIGQVTSGMQQVQATAETLSGVLPPAVREVAQDVIALGGSLTEAVIQAAKRN